MSRTSFDRLEHQFAAGARLRGDRYFREGRVHLSRLDASAIAAEVRGTHRYDASLRFEERSHSWQLFCSCKAFADLGPCKHLWATIQAARAHAAKPEDPARLAPDPKATRGSVFDLAERIGAQRPRTGDAEGGVDPEFTEADVEALEAQIAAKVPKANPLAELRALVARSATGGGGPTLADRRLRYVLEVPGGPAARTPVGEDALVHVFWQRRYKRGGYSEPRPYHVRERGERSDLSAEDLAIVSLLRGATGEGMWAYGSSFSFAIPPALQPIVLPRMAKTGCLHLSVARDVRKEPIVADGGGRWELGIGLTRAETAVGFSIEGFLARGAERMPLAAPIAVFPGGIAVAEDRLAEVDWRGAWECAAILRRVGKIAVSRKSAPETLDLVRNLPGDPRLEAAGILREIGGPPRPHLLLAAPAPSPSAGAALVAKSLEGRIAFEYEGQRVAWRDDRRLQVADDALVRVLRDDAAERAAVDRLLELGAELSGDGVRDHDVSFPARELSRIVAALVAQDWRVEAEGRALHGEGSLALSIRSGIDWFDLEGRADFGDASATLPDLLRAIQSGVRIVRLSDGSFGVLPDAWLAGWGLSGCAVERDGSLRFRRSQAWLLDLLLAERGEADVDAAFVRAREELRRFERFEPALEPEGFRGELRAYQREGLGWLALLRDLGLGGCLADDMGLGKTVQVLALLADGAHAKGRPSLVVAPRSVVFNWLREAERFAPRLSVLAHHGSERTKDASAIASHDLVVTTYGTLRRDIELLSKIPFSHAILDEAQAIKNPSSQSAKAARLLAADHRLVLTGTPVENHLDDLWSLFEFLNPGMLGRSQVFREIVEPAREEEPGTEARATKLLARALRPFLLRRTKEQVLPELPAKIEQVIACDLEGAELRRYEELRDHYRASLLARLDEQGMEKSRMHVLEALLRLRQAACHPGLIDPTRVGESSAKLDALLPMLEEVRESGHKALVFSQFTSFLAIVRERLAAQGVVHEYLDGRTRDREEKVQRFQEDAACPLFLISLKAGGFGLNLTAADYVFLLDPWWNPAVERQAIDRTHRIGQTRTVNAYRLVASGTIEEKVLELQEKKRAVAEAILGGTEGTLRDLTREDLERLLS